MKVLQIEPYATVSSDPDRISLEIGQKFHHLLILKPTVGEISWMSSPETLFITEREKGDRYVVELKDEHHVKISQKFPKRLYDGSKFNTIVDLS